LIEPNATSVAQGINFDIDKNVSSGCESGEYRVQEGVYALSRVIELVWSVIGNPLSVTRGIIMVIRRHIEVVGIKDKPEHDTEKQVHVMEHNHAVRDIGGGLKIVRFGNLVEVKLQTRSDGSNWSMLFICVWGQFGMSRPDSKFLRDTLFVTVSHGTVSMKPSARMHMSRVTVGVNDSESWRR
jgi:hypothetical protein